MAMAAAQQRQSGPPLSRRGLGLTAGLTMLVSLVGEQAAAEASPLVTNADGRPPVVDLDLTVDTGAPNVNRWRAYHAERCLHVAEEPSNEVEGFQALVRRFLNKSSLGRQMFADLQGSDASMCDGSVVGSDNGNLFFSTDFKAAIIPYGLAPGYLAMGTLHEMRHGWQDHMGLAERPSRLDQQAYMAQTYMMAADASAFAVAASWQLKETGFPDAWDYLNRDRYYQPIAAAFEQSLTDAGEASDGTLRTAMQAAYRAWFEATDLASIYRDRAGEHLNGLAVTGLDQRQQRAALMERVRRIADNAGRSADAPDLYLGQAEASLAVARAYEIVPVASSTLSGPATRRTP